MQSIIIEIYLAQTFNYHNCESLNLLRQAWNFKRATANLAFKKNETVLPWWRTC